MVLRVLILCIFEVWWYILVKFRICFKFRELIIFNVYWFSQKQDIYNKVQNINYQLYLEGEYMYQSLGILI